MGKEYQLFISFPLSYSTKDTVTYPVLYVLDGERDFDLFYHINKFLRNGKTEEVIIVGIGSGGDVKSRAINRGHDFTPSTNLDSMGIIERAAQFDLPAGALTSGGAANYLIALKTEIIPFVDKNYKTNSDSGITGHSLGGLFTTYCLFTIKSPVVGAITFDLT